jgi:hypothetical protein
MAHTLSLPGIRSVLFTVIGLLLAGAASGQGVPDWYLSLPADPALIAGRGAVERGGGSEATALAQAKREAMRDLSESLLCRLTSEIIDHQQEHSAASVESQFASRTVVESALELVNVRTLHEAVTRDMAFVAVAVDRTEMARAYRDRTSRLFRTAQQAFEQAGTLEAANDARSALSAYESCLAALRDARGALQVYLALNRWNDGGLDVPAVPDATDVETRLKRLACRGSGDKEAGTGRMPLICCGSAVC